MNDIEEILKKRDLIGRRCLYVAWLFEIALAILFLFISFLLAFDAYNTSDQGKIINAFLGSLPFFLVALLEPTKIFLTIGLYRPKHIVWKTILFVLLLLLTLSSFETMFTYIEHFFYSHSPLPSADNYSAIIFICVVAFLTSTIGPILTFFSCILRFPFTIK